MNVDLPAIRTVLSAYRSTTGHITKDQITEAWAEYEHARAALGALFDISQGHTPRGYVNEETVLHAEEILNA